MARGSIEFNTQEFAAGVQAAADRMKVSAYQELEKLANRIKEIARQETPVDTGQTAASWYVQMSQGPRGPEAKIGNKNTPVAIYLEYGVRPHIIRVKNASVLADEFGNVFGTEVFHPGFPGRQMLQQALFELGYTFEGVRIHA